MDRCLDRNKKYNKSNRKSINIERVVHSRDLGVPQYDRAKLRDVSPYDYSKRSILDIKTEAVA